MSLFAYKLVNLGIELLSYLRKIKALTYVEPSTCIVLKANFPPVFIMGVRNLYLLAYSDWMRCLQFCLGSLQGLVVCCLSSASPMQGCNDLLVVILKQ